MSALLIDRQEIERQIIEKVITDAIAKGYCMSISDGEDSWLLKASTDLEAIKRNLHSMDEDYLHFHAFHTGHTTFVGWVRFVYGNDGHDVIADHVDNERMRELLTGATELAETFANGA